MTTVVHPGNSLHGLGKRSSLCKEKQVDELDAIKSISHSPPVTHKSLPPVVPKKPARSKRRELKSPPPAPMRSSSISVTHKAKGSLKEKVSFVSVDKSNDFDHSMDKSEGQSVSIGSKPSPHIGHAQISPRDRGDNVSSNVQDSFNSSTNDGVKDGRKLRFILSTSHPQPDEIGQRNLLKPRDRLRSILVSDSNEDGDDNFSYGYNASLMKISHGDVQKHTVAVTTPRVPSTSPHMSQNDTSFDPNNLNSSQSQEVIERSPVNIKDELFPLKRPRSSSSPFDLQKENSKDIAKTDANQLNFSDPIARAYRQHLMTRLEKDKQLVLVHKPLQVLQNGSRKNQNSLWLDENDEPGQPILTSTILSQSSSQLDMQVSESYACELSPMNSKSKTPVSPSTSSANTVYNDGQQNISLTDIPMQMKHGVQNSCSSPSISDSVKFVEQSHSSQVGASSVQLYGTLPHSHRYQKLYASTDHIMQGQREMIMRAKSISNLRARDRSDEGSSSISQQSCSSLSSNVSQKLCPFQSPKDGDVMGKLERRKRNPNEFILADYISYHSAHFPKRVQITKGIYNNSTGMTFSQGDVLDLYFVHQTKSVMMTDSDQIQYIVPMSSLAMFSVLYDPFNVEKVAIFGFHFKTAGAVMDLKNPPTVMASTQTIDGGSSESSLEKGEILILQGVKNVFHGRLLKVFSVKTNLMKFLDDHCTADFTTDPAMIKMSLPQIYDCSIPLPQKIILHPSNTMVSFIPNSMQEHALMLKKFTISKFVVAAAYLSNKMSSSSECSILDLDVSLDLDVQEVLTVEDECEKMQQTMQKLINKFDERAVVPYVNMLNPSLRKVQLALFTNLDTKSTLYTTEIIPAGEGTLPKVQNDTQKNTFSSGSEMKQTPDTRMEQRLKTIEAKQVKMETKVSSICEHLDDISCKMDKIHTYLSKAQIAMNEHKRKESDKDQPVSKSVGENLSTSSDSSRVDLNPISSVSEESSIDSPLIRQKFILGQGKARPAVSKLRGERTCKSMERTCKSMDDVNDEVFAKSAKPSILPKPRRLIKKTEQITATHNISQKDKEPTKKKEPVKRSKSRPVLSMKDESVKSGSTLSYTTTLPASSKHSLCTSVDFGEDLLSKFSSTKADKVDDQLHRSSDPSQNNKESTLEEHITDGNIDTTDWFSQIEEELAQLYNDSVLQQT